MAKLTKKEVLNKIEELKNEPKQLMKWLKKNKFQVSFLGTAGAGLSAGVGGLTVLLTSPLTQSTIETALPFVGSSLGLVLLNKYLSKKSTIELAKNLRKKSKLKEIID